MDNWPSSGDEKKKTEKDENDEGASNAWGRMFLG